MLRKRERVWSVRRDPFAAPELGLTSQLTDIRNTTSPTIYQITRPLI